MQGRAHLVFLDVVSISCCVFFSTVVINACSVETSGISVCMQM